MQINGLQVTYTDTDGTQKTMNAMGNWELYSKLMANNDAQKVSASTNLNASGKYLTDLHSYQQWPDKLSPPDKPKMIVVSDMGVESKVDFVPALPDPVIPVTGGPSVPGAVNRSQPAPLSDAEQAIMSALIAISGDIAKLKAKLGVM